MLIYILHGIVYFLSSHIYKNNNKIFLILKCIPNLLDTFRFRSCLKLLIMMILPLLPLFHIRGIDYLIAQGDISFKHLEFASTEIYNPPFLLYFRVKEAQKLTELVY
jgi:hypothetical protein